MSSSERNAFFGGKVVFFGHLTSTKKKLRRKKTDKFQCQQIAPAKEPSKNSGTRPMQCVGETEARLC